MTKLMYIENPNLYETTAQITKHGSDSKGIYLVLNQSLFYPQGGGQPADQGEIIVATVAYKVFDVRMIDGEVRHYIIDDAHDNFRPGENVRLIVDKNRRAINSKYHTTGHLIAAVTEKIFSELKAIKGHQFPGEAYIEFNGIINDQETFIQKITKALNESITNNPTVKTEELNYSDLDQIAENLSYALPTRKSLRVCHIEGFPPVPCGGTHVDSLKEISTVEIIKCKISKGKTKIYYEFL